MKQTLPYFFSFFAIVSGAQALAQTNLLEGKNHFTKADTLRGSLSPERSWWDVQRYEIAIKPNYHDKSLVGNTIIKYKVVKANDGATKMQIDLQEPLHIDSIKYNNAAMLHFEKHLSVWYVTVPKQLLNAQNAVNVFYSGQLHVAKTPPWDGGFIFSKDAKGRPWMTTACQGLGASVWYPNKDHQSDEPDKGASLTMVVADTLNAVANGKKVAETKNADGTKSVTFNVNSPINNYCITPYIGKYVNFNEQYKGEKGNLSLNYWVLDYNLEKAKSYMPDQVHKTLKALEYWFGPYPWYQDGYQLVEAPHLGMEHQSAVAYGNKYGYGYLGRDLSHSGWGLKFDFIIEHESGHEWFGNNITSKDLADMWIHESFTNYSETLYADYFWGKEAGNAYNYGTRKAIANDEPIIPPYGVNAEGSGDMYYKGGNMLQSIRHSLNNDVLFRSILRGLNAQFGRKTVTSNDIISYFNTKTKYNYSPVFQQYLTTVQIPQFDFYFKGNQLFYKYSNCIDGFNLPILLVEGKTTVRLVPAKDWKSIKLTGAQKALFTAKKVDAMYCVKVVEQAN